MDRLQRSILGRATLVVVVVVATIALTSETSFSETLQCRTSPGAAAPPGTHWYYRVDRTNNRHCWYTQAAGFPVYSRRNGMPSNPTLHIARERISAPLISAPLQTDPTELSQLETAKADSTDTLTPSVDEPTASVEKPTANFTTRWSDLPKSVDLDQHKSTTRDDDASEPAASDSTKPVASTGFVSAGSKREMPQKSASAVYFWSIFLAGNSAHCSSAVCLSLRAGCTAPSRGAGGHQTITRKQNRASLCVPYGESMRPLTHRDPSHRRLLSQMCSQTKTA